MIRYITQQILFERSQHVASNNGWRACWCGNINILNDFYSEVPVLGFSVRIPQCYLHSALVVFQFTYNTTFRTNLRKHNTMNFILRLKTYMQALRESTTRQNNFNPCSHTSAVCYITNVHSSWCVHSLVNYLVDDNKHTDITQVYVN